MKEELPGICPPLAGIFLSGVNQSARAVGQIDRSS